MASRDKAYRRLGAHRALAVTTWMPLTYVSRIGGADSQLEAASVTAPREAELTSRAYFASKPRSAFAGGGVHARRRRSIVSRETPSSMVLRTASMTIES